MTTNARDEKWSEWIDCNGGRCPINNGTKYQVRFRLGSQCGVQEAPENLDWFHRNSDNDIIAYRYKIKEPESDMHPDLKWLAENVSEWNDNFNFVQCTRLEGSDPMPIWWQSHNPFRYAKAEWQAARQKLGLDNTGIADPDEEECLQLAYERMGDESVKVSVDGLREQKYSAYFKDVRHIDTIDVYRVVSLFDCEKHGHAISHAAKKLLLTGARTGGKDVETEVREAIDSLHRWLEMREEDARA